MSLKDMIRSACTNPVSKRKASKIEQFLQLYEDEIVDCYVNEHFTIHAIALGLRQDTENCTWSLSTLKPRVSAFLTKYKRPRSKKADTQAQPTDQATAEATA